MSRIDWTEVQYQYITGPDQLTYGVLADSLGVSKSAVQKRGRKGCWVEAREEYRKMALWASVSESASRTAARYARILGDCDRLLDRLEKCISQSHIRADRGVVRERTVKYDNPDLPHKVTGEIVKETPVITTVESIVDPASLRHVAATLRDVKQIVQPDQKDVRTTDTIHVTFKEGIEEFTV